MSTKCPFDHYNNVVKHRCEAELNYGENQPQFVGGIWTIVYPRFQQNDIPPPNAEQSNNIPHREVAQEAMQTAQAKITEAIEETEELCFLYEEEGECLSGIFVQMEGVQEILEDICHAFETALIYNRFKDAFCWIGSDVTDELNLVGNNLLTPRMILNDLHNLDNCIQFLSEKIGL